MCRPAQTLHWPPSRKVHAVWSHFTEYAHESLQLPERHRTLEVFACSPFGLSRADPERSLPSCPVEQADRALSRAVRMDSTGIGTLDQLQVVRYSRAKHSKCSMRCGHR